MTRFSGQVAIVTGGARGIGKAIVSRLAKEGAQVVIFDVLQDAMTATLKEFKNQNLNVYGKTVDITDENQVKTRIDDVVKTYGRLDITVNCAGIVGPTATKIEDYSYAEFQKVIDVNLNGPFLITKYSIPHMVKQQYGRILLIGSIGGKEGNPGMAGYASSKSGVMGLVKGIGKEYADAGITVNGLAPAVIATPMNLDTDPKMMEYMVKKIPMGRLGTVEEVAAISSWIVSKEASFNTGVVFDISGGRATF